MSIYIGDKEVTMAYLGSLPIVNSIGGFAVSPTGSLVTNGLIHYFNANTNVSSSITSSWVDTLTTASTVFWNPQITYVDNLPSSSFFNFSGSVASNLMNFGSAPLPSNTDRTVILWVNPKRSTGNAQVVQYMGDSSATPPGEVSGFGIWQGKLAYLDGDPEFIASYQTGSGISNIQLNQWQQIAVTFNSTSSIAVLYKNLESSSFTSSANYTDADYWEIGEEAALRHYTGSVANQLIYNRVLTNQEIQETYYYFNQFYQ